MVNGPIVSTTVSPLVETPPSAGGGAPPSLPPVLPASPVAALPLVPPELHATVAAAVRRAEIAAHRVVIGASLRRIKREACLTLKIQSPPVNVSGASPHDFRRARFHREACVPPCRRNGGRRIDMRITMK